MAVKLIDHDKFYGLRVRRTINRRLYQEYYSLKKDGTRISINSIEGKIIGGEASARDNVLELMQIKDKLRRKAELCFCSNGKVRGINFLNKTEKSGTISPIFQMGIQSAIENRIVCTSTAIKTYGKRDAWLRIIDIYCKHKKINKRSKLYGKLLAAMPDISA